MNHGVRDRLAEAGKLESVVRESAVLDDPAHPGADIRTPLVARLDATADRAVYTREWFGPVSFVIATPTDPAFVTGRFTTLQVRRPAEA